MEGAADEDPPQCSARSHRREMPGVSVFGTQKAEEQRTVHLDLEPKIHKSHRGCSWAWLIFLIGKRGSDSGNGRRSFVGIGRCDNYQHLREKEGGQSMDTNNDSIK